MSTSRKWAMGVLVVASMAVAGVASALDDALVESMTSDISASIMSVTDGTEDQKVAAVKAAVDAKTQYAGKIDELIQALADAKVADAVAAKVLFSAAPALTKDEVTQNLAAAKIVTETKNSATAVNPVTAAGNAQNQTQGAVQDGGTGNGAFSGSSFSAAPSSVGAGTGVSRT